MTPEEELIYLEGLKEYINTRMKALHNKVSNDKRPRFSGHKLSYNGLYVQSSCLIPFIKREIDSGVSIMALAARATVSDTQIRRILNGQIEWTREEIADKIMVRGLALVNEFNDLERVRLKRKYSEIPKKPESPYFEE